jgi:hypothetical protein
MAIDFDKPVAADLESTNWLNMRDMYSALTRMVMVGALNRPLGSLALSSPNGTNRTLTQWNGTADVQFDLTVKKLVVSSGVLDLFVANAYISATNTEVTFNADANDYMQYDRVNNTWRWVIGGAIRFYSSPARLMVWEGRSDEPNAGQAIVNRGTSSAVAGSVYFEVSNEINVPKSFERIILNTDGSSSKESYLTPIGVARNVNFQTLAMRLISGASAALVRMILGTITDDNSTQLQVTTLTAKGRAHTPRVTLASGGTTVVFDFGSTNVWGITLTASITTMSVVNGANDGQTSQIRFKQDATGGRTVALPASFKVSGALNTSPNRVTILQVTFTADGNLFEGAWVQVPA